MLNNFIVQDSLAIIILLVEEWLGKSWRLCPIMHIIIMVSKDYVSLLITNVLLLSVLLRQDSIV